MLVGLVDGRSRAGVVIGDAVDDRQDVAPGASALEKPVGGHTSLAGFRAALVPMSACASLRREAR